MLDLFRYLLKNFSGRLEVRSQKNPVNQPVHPPPPKKLCSERPCMHTILIAFLAKNNCKQQKSFCIHTIFLVHVQRVSKERLVFEIQISHFDCDVLH